MDENQFAAITKAMGREVTRRRALGRLVAGVAAASGVGALLNRTALAVIDPDYTAGQTSQPKNIVPVLWGACGNLNTCAPDELSNNEVDGFAIACGQLGYDFGFKVDGGENWNDSQQGVTYKVSGGAEGETFLEWSSDHPIGAVVVKGANVNDVYEYPGGAKGDGSVAALTAPKKISNDQFADISHFSFCWNKPLDVSKTAKTSYDRDWTWTVAKSADQSSLKLSVGQTFTPVNYTVKYDATKADSNFKVEGKITIKNPNPSAAATITNVTDEIDQGGPPTAATVNCGVNFPYNLAGGGELVCTYSATLTSKTDGKNTAKVTTDGTVPGGSGKADVTFGAPSNETDECVTVSDSNTGTNVSGQACAPADTPKTFNYSRSVGPYSTCGDYTVNNTASFETNDNKEKGSSTWTIKVNVPCAGGCTLTQGYWKTHSEKGPAPYDDTWAKLANGANTPFFLSGKSYYEVLWTPPAGNPYYTLAHQYIAAELNILNGADGSAVSSQMTAAKTLFMSNTPTQVATGGKTLQNKFKALVGPLDNYNNGVSGPGHCSENSAVSAQETEARSGPSKKSRKQRGKRGKGRGHGRK
jgi:hypothetical protein